jgi:lysyl-tRNA synthetase class 2
MKKNILPENAAPTPVSEGSSLSEHEVRLAKVAKLRELGIDPWPSALEVMHTAAQVVAEYTADHEKRYQVAGRILTIRGHGKTVFATVQDRSGKVQVYLKHDQLGDQFEIFTQLIDVGDIVWFEGTSFKTKMGEITLAVSRFQLLSKCLYPLPEKFHGLADVETRYRQRYLDLISSPESRSKFLKRSALVKSLRAYLDAHECVEVETPMLHPIAGGAAAKPFKTHHNALDSEFYLRIAPELYLKRLVVGGLERVYEINRNFRNEGISTRHNPEFTMLELYIAYKDYKFGMDFTEEMIRMAVQNACHTLKVPYGEYEIDFGVPFNRMSLKESIERVAGCSAHMLEPDKIDELLALHDITLPPGQDSYSRKLFTLFEELVEPKLIQPTFITHLPLELSPLAKKDAEDPLAAARFELFIGGMEVANSYNELNDPFDQATRFQDQLKAHQSGDEEAHQFDAEYVHALEYGLPPTVGIGIGIDRLTMLVTNTTSIKDVILFPTLKKR